MHPDEWKSEDIYKIYLRKLFLSAYNLDEVKSIYDYCFRYATNEFTNSKFYKPNFEMLPVINYQSARREREIMAVNRCVTCVYSRLDLNTLFCRKNPPTHSGFPIVSPDDWCGEWKLDTEETV